MEPGSHGPGTSRRPVCWEGVWIWVRGEMCSEAIRAKLGKTAPYVPFRGAQGLQKQALSN